MSHYNLIKHSMLSWGFFHAQLCQLRIRVLGTWPKIHRSMMKLLPDICPEYINESSFLAILLPPKDNQSMNNFP